MGNLIRRSSYLHRLFKFHVVARESHYIKFRIRIMERYDAELTNKLHIINVIGIISIFIYLLSSLEYRYNST
jgi:hypothetical protein